MERHGIEWEDKGHPRQAPVCAGLQEGAEGERDRRLGNSQGGEREQVESQERAAERTGPGGEGHGAAGGGISPLTRRKFCRRLAKIVKVLRSLFRKYIDLKGKFDRLQGDYDRVREGNARLSDRLMEVKMETKNCGRSPPTIHGSSGSLARNRWRRRWRPTGRGSKRRKAANGRGTPLTGEEGKKWIYKVFYDILLLRNRKINRELWRA